MKKIFRSFVCLFLITFLLNATAFAQSSRNSSASKVLATAPPTVNSPIYLCQNSVATPLTATPSGGGTLNWYTTLTGGVALAGAPTPSTVAVGTTTYYVTETVGGVDSDPRTPIVVNVVADNGAVILNLTCDPSQILLPDKFSSVYFDWSNNPLINDNNYSYSYSIQGGPPVTGTTAVSHLQVFGMLPGQSATIILSATTFPCVPSQTMTCKVPCIVTTTPTFDPIPAFCTGTPAPSLPASSKEGITGTWSPAIINNTTSATYTFTPDPILFPCATTQTLNVTVTPLVTPTFSGIPAIVCQNAPAPVLPAVSSNATPVTGSWSPSTVNTSTLGPVTYTFTPDPGQCTSATFTTVVIRIDPVVTPDFAPIPDICYGSTAPVLANTSPNGIVGTWSPATVSNTASGNYLFTPNPNQCATTQSLSVTVIPKTVPDFPAVPAFCSGSAAPVLTNTSPNGITGTWSPATVSNTTSGSYVFTPNPTECATNQTLNIVVNPLVDPDFDNMSMCSGSVAPILPNSSPNGITGTWNPSTVDNMNSGTYVFTPDSPQCANTKTIDVTVNPSNTLVNVDWTVTEAFSKNQIVTVTATASGNYLYQLDSGPLQSSPVFENVSSGLHSITVVEPNGCSASITVDDVLVIGYPKYFTPNGDTYNDTWNIFTLSGQLDSRIYIFDRYGKLLKEISPKDPVGWDGTYIGQPMPSGDYWFTVDYVENSTVKKFKAHFSLKR